MCIRGGRLALPTVLLLIAALSGACDTLFGGDGDRGLEIRDGGVCIKDREELSELLARPRACSTSDECPGGSFCDIDAGRCDWDCFTDSDCGSGFTCSCGGRCESPSALADAGVGDPSCPRELAVLATIAERACIRDEHCAVGASCDPVTRHCTYECANTAECGSGEVCDCRGECVVPGVGTVPQPTTKPTTVITPEYVTVSPDSAWGPQTIAVRIETEAESLPPGTSPRARIEVRSGVVGLAAAPTPGDPVTVISGVYFSASEETRALTALNNASASTLESELGVPRDVATAIVASRSISSLRELVVNRLVGAPTLQRLKAWTASTSAVECGPGGAAAPRILMGNDWTPMAATAGGYAAQASVLVGHCDATGPTIDEPLQLAISTYLVRTNAPDSVVRQLDYRIIDIGPGATSAGQPIAPSGVYEGEVTILGDAFSAPLRIPVQAWATRADALVLHDELSLLSGSGPFVLTSQATFFTATAPADGAHGQLTGRVSGWTEDARRSGLRTGSFTLTIGPGGLPRRAFYSVRRLGPDNHPLSGDDSALARAPTCNASTACAAGTTCIRQLAPAGGSDATAGRCMPGTTAPASLANSVDHPSEATWRSNGSFLDSDANPAAFLPLGGTIADRLVCHPYRASEQWNGRANSDQMAAARLVTPTDRTDTAGASSGVDPTTGEILCRDVQVDGDGILRSPIEYTQTVVPLATGTRTSRADLPHPVEPLGDAALGLAACLGDLARVTPTVTADMNGDGAVDYRDRPLRIRAWFGGTSGRCINLAQYFPSLAATALGSVGGAATITTGLDGRLAGMFQRLMTQWLDVHAYVLQQGLQEREATRSLDANAASMTLPQLLTTADTGWDLLLDASYSAAMDRLTPLALREMDYRAPRPAHYYSFDRVHRNDHHVMDLTGRTNLGLYALADEDYLAPQGEMGGFYARVSADQAGIPTGDATVSLWINAVLESRADTYPITSGALSVFIDVGRGSYTICAGVANTRLACTARLSEPQGGDWTHVVVRRHMGTFSIYSNGIGRSLTSTNNTATPTPGGDLLIGTEVGQELDELAIWNEALGETDIATLYARGRTPGNQRLAPTSSYWNPTNPSWGASANHDLRLGLPVKILDTAASHATAAHEFATEALADVYGSCYLSGTSTAQRNAIGRASQSIRRLNAVESLAVTLYNRSAVTQCTQDFECDFAAERAGDMTALVCGDAGTCETTSGETWLDEPAWAGAYHDAFGRFAAARADAVEAIARVSRCENPLGIPEDDLPLYFGDVTGDNARFFASSDYVMDRWAIPTVRDAVTSLADARSAWTNMRQSNVQQTMSEQDAERRMEGLTKSYVQPIVDACGLVDYDTLDVIPAFDRGELTTRNCFRASDCSSDVGVCLRGQIGAALLDIKAASNALQQEKRNQERRHAELDAQVATCERVRDGISQDLAAIREFKASAAAARDAMDRGFFGGLGGTLDSVVSAFIPGDTDMFSEGLDVLGGCLGSAIGGAAAGMAIGGPWGAAGGAVLGCAMGLDGEEKSDAAENLDIARDKLNHALTKGQLLREQNACWDEANSRLRDVVFGVSFAKEQLIALEQAWYRYDELSRATERNLAEARSVLRREQGRTLPSIAHHFWTDEKVANYRHSMERARRMTFLAMRAIEFELQQSLGFRSAILSAVRPDELQRIVEELDVERGARTLNGRRPAAGTEVLSLRTDILGLLDNALAPVGERTDSSVSRLQDILTSPEYAVWNGDEYVGQAIPFSVAESGALRHRCAERLWRVSATIQGDITDIAEPGTHVLLRKNNVFQSQWCDGMGDGSDYQRASTSHTANLLSDDDMASSANRAEYTTAVLFPWFNVRRSDFYRDAYADGATEELAGRGLYGEYVLLFPYYGMLEPDGTCNPNVQPACADPFRHLRQVEDVLIRFDYYSVDDLRQ